jgi:hypothetical protein
MKIIYLGAITASMLLAGSNAGSAKVNISAITKCTVQTCSNIPSAEVNDIYYYDVQVNLKNLAKETIWNKSEVENKKISAENNTRVYLRGIGGTASSPIQGYVAIQQREGIHGDSYIPDQWVAADWSPITGYAFDQWTTYGVFDFAWDENRPYVYPSLEDCETRLSKDFSNDTVSGYTRAKLLADYEAAATMDGETLDDTYMYDGARFAIGHPFYGFQHNYHYTQERREHFRCEPLTTAAALKEKMDNELHQYDGTGIYSNIDKLFEELANIRDVMEYPQIEKPEISYEIYSLTNLR